MLTNLEYFLPEIFLATAALSALIVGAYDQRNAVLKCYGIALATMVAAILILLLNTQKVVSLWHNQIVYDDFAWLLKLAILGSAILVMLAIRQSIFTDAIAQPELPVLILLAVLGMMIMVSAQTFLTLFIGLELQSLSLYVLTTLRRDDIRSSEAGMKYFLLGALSTGIMLYGISFVYGTVGSVNFFAIADFLNTTATIPLTIYLGFVFILAGLVFKISVAPFHMWTPDVYEGAPTSVTAFLATVPKIAAFGMIVRVLSQPFAAMVSQWQILIVVLAIVTMIVGAFAALAQRNIKRLIAYSAIGNMGYALMALVVVTPDSVQAGLIYVFIYTLTTIGIFACLLTIQRRGLVIEEISDLAGLTKTFPGTTFVMAFLLFSMAGIPPLAGFLGKLYVFQVAIAAKLYVMAFVGIATSVISAAYYLWIIKTMVMDEISDALNAGDVPQSRPLNTVVVMGAVTGGLGLFFLKPSVMVSLILTAVASLFLR